MTGKWKQLTHQPAFNASTMLLLTSGEVMCQDAGAAVGSRHWWKLTPDVFGSYVKGTWSQLADGPTSPQFYASAVLRDGRVFVAGGEYNGSVAVADLLAAQIYDPLTDVWTKLPMPPAAGWIAIGDASCCVLPDGQVLIGSIADARCAIYDPVANAWNAAASKGNATTNEETWTLLPDETVLSADCFGHPATEKYVIAADKWVSAGSTPPGGDLVEDASKEIGPALLLPDGRLFAVGTTGHTALYSMPPIASQPGSWTKGPDFPKIGGKTLGAKDAPGCLLPNGRVLCVAAVVDGNKDTWSAPTYFFEFDPVTSKLKAVSNPANNGNPPYFGRMLLLPTGQVLFANGSHDIRIYTPKGGPDPWWRPNITHCSTQLKRHHTYTVHGRQLNGLSQAVSYGDDATMATNYPLVRIRHRHSKKLHYCRTHNHSTMGLQTGTVIHSTQFTVPAGVSLGHSELYVVANGIASEGLRVRVHH